MTNKQSPDKTVALNGAAATRRLHLPDYELARCVGAGAYGDVWLARNVAGSFRAVKVVYRKNFENEGAFEREFRGIRKFEAVSGTHAGLLSVLHIGRDDAAGHFYYVMEIADDENTGAAIDPELYRARTLASDLSRRGSLPIEECVGLGLKLADALAHLHRHGLIHRDVKPANIIFVKGQPKLADIGLVTDIGEASWVGTPPYIPPEGPGRPTGDIFSLGKVLYVAATGQQAQNFPNLPADSKLKDTPVFHALSRIIHKACEPDLAKRYASAEALRDDLQRLAPRQPASARGRLAEVRLRGAKAVLAAALVLALGAGVWFLLKRPGGGFTQAGRVPAIPARTVLNLIYASTPPSPGPSLARPALRLEILAKRKNETAFAALADGATLASEQDDYLLAVHTGSAGYLYVFQVDSSGRHDWLFPKNPGCATSSGANPVGSNEVVQVPAAELGRVLYLDKATGVEHVYAIYGAARWLELEQALAAVPASLAAPAAPSEAGRLVGTVRKRFGLGLRGVGGIRASTTPVNLPDWLMIQRTQQGQSIRFLMNGPWLEATNSVLVVERWFQHIDP